MTRPRLNRYVTAFKHPLRLQIIHFVRARHAATPKEMAEAFDVPLENLSYHVRALHRGGFLRGIGTRQVRGAVAHKYAVNERIVRAAADELRQLANRLEQRERIR